MLESKSSKTSDVSPDHDWPGTKESTRHSSVISLQWLHASNTLLIESSGLHTKLRLQTQPRLHCALTNPHATHDDGAATMSAAFDLRAIYNVYLDTKDDDGQFLLRFCDDNAMAAARFFQ